MSAPGNERRQVIAVDVDGTLYDGESIHPDAIAALDAARSEGDTILIVSGRPWRDLPVIAPEIVALAAAAVCEDGAVLVDIATGERRRFAEPPPLAVVDELQRRGATGVVAGEVAIGMPAEFVEIARAVVAEHPGTLRIEHNKDSVAIAPIGCNKGTGLERALEHLGAPDALVLAIGDASNDLPMFRAADVAMAVANADRAVVDAGIERSSLPCGAGVAEIVRAHLSARRDRQRAVTDADPLATRTS
jgi:hydroxymethylpyrimidine pyrophosphatase-like HAD family hydrolase